MGPKPIKANSPKPKAGQPGGIQTRKGRKQGGPVQVAGGQQENMAMMGRIVSVNQMGMMNQPGMLLLKQEGMLPNNEMGKLGQLVMMNHPGMVLVQQQGMTLQSGEAFPNIEGLSQKQQQVQQGYIQYRQQMQLQHHFQLQQQQNLQQQQQMQQPIQYQPYQQLQNPQLSQMMDQQPFMNQRTLQNTHMQVVQMQNEHIQMQNTQAQMQVQTAQITGMMPQQQQNILQNQIATNPTTAQQPTMSRHLKKMVVLQHQLQQVENVNMVGPYPGQPPQAMQQKQQQRVNPFIPPNTSQGMSIASTPSPTPMAVPSQVGPSPSYGNSPGANTIMHSPAGPGMNINNLRTYSNQIIGGPSPNPNLNTPMSMAATPSPSTADDQACIEKLKELKKYTDLLQRMMAKFSNEDVEKASKMTKLLEILTLPGQTVSMEILLKCEKVLKRMEIYEARGMGPFTPPPTPTKDTTSGFKQIQESIINALKGGSSNHTLLRTFRHTIEAFGAPLDSPECAADDVDSESDSESSSDLPSVLMKELQFLDKRCIFKLHKSRGTVASLIVFVTLRDTRLPIVPPLKIIVSNKYPVDRPTILNFYSEYVSTPFFLDVSKAMKLRLGCVCTKPTVTEIIDCWEMSVRQAIAPLHKKHHTVKIRM